MGKLDVLWAYQAADLEKEQLERQILQTPSRVEFNKLHAFLTESQNTMSKMQKDIVQKQAALDKLKAQIEKSEEDIELERAEFEGMLRDEECTAAELTECRENYEQLLRSLHAMHKELNVLVHSMENTLEGYNKTGRDASKAKKEYDVLRVVCEQEIKDSEETRKKAEANVQAKAKLVDPRMLERYQRIKQNHSIPMAKVDNKQCGGCNMSLPTVVMKRVQNDDNIVECENCGRILYLTEEE